LTTGAGRTGFTAAVGIVMVVLGNRLLSQFSNQNWYVLITAGTYINWVECPKQSLKKFG
jgi:hypothetical protein